MLGQELQDERHPYKHKPDGGIDGGMSREENLSHPLSLSLFLQFSFGPWRLGGRFVWPHTVCGIIQRVISTQLDWSKKQFRFVDSCAR